MKRKRIALENQINYEINHQKNFKITKDGDECFFEIDNEMTSDVAEAVSILMKKLDWNDPFWKSKINKESVKYVMPERSLYYLSGGDIEWHSQLNYTKPWYECFPDFLLEYNDIILDIIENSETLLDVRDGFLEYLNLPTIYNFALSKKFVN